MTPFSPKTVRAFLARSVPLLPFLENRELDIRKLTSQKSQIPSKTQHETLYMLSVVVNDHNSFIRSASYTPLKSNPGASGGILWS